ncbi:MAG: polysaccharide biosynthesis protein GtrA [Neobacillus sp.]|jgi:phosphoserine phosphatase|nr:polysaccharide biosynthesis protein GtrA [Neobacillus sp.]
MECNAYDFDKTIYNGDATLDFYKYCIRRYPRVLLALPFAMVGAVLYILKFVPKTRFKELFFGFLRFVPNVEALISSFWDENSERIFTWYLENKEENDIIISASPEFLLKPMCNRLDIQYLIASKVDMKTGRYTGKNCYGEEKVRRLKNEFEDCVINEFYSDSLSDLPLARLAKERFLVRDKERKAWIIKD